MTPPPSDAANTTREGRWQRIYRVVRRVPRGQVATYGQIAELANLPGHARQVGYALSALRDQDVPWHRIVNARGEVSPRSAGESVRANWPTERSASRKSIASSISVNAAGVRTSAP